MNLSKFIDLDSLYYPGITDQSLYKPISGGAPTLLKPGMIKLLSRDLTPEEEGLSGMSYISTWLKSRMWEYYEVEPSYEDRILIVQAKTGSGKSTVMPGMLYDLLKKSSQRGIVCTQPKVFTAQQIAIDMSNSTNYPNLKIRDTIGYITGVSKVRTREKTSLIYMTVGSLLQIIRSMGEAELMKSMRIIIIDEAHERSMELDLVLSYLKKFLKKNYANYHCPFLIITSATFDTEKYAKYFEVPRDNIVLVEGQNFPIYTKWLQHDSSDFSVDICNAVREIHTSEDDPEYPGKDVLIFVPGDAEMQLVEEKLKKMAIEFHTGGVIPYLILSVNSKKVSSDNIQKRLIFYKYENLKVAPDGTYDKTSTVVPNRRVILSTTVAETGLTIETCGYVIDFGLDRHNELYAPYCINGLVTKPAPQSKITQRKGRTGRLFPGKFYPIYKEITYNKLSEQQLPSILIEELDKYLLFMMKTTGEDTLSIDTMDMLDMPPVDSIKQTMEVSYLLGYIKRFPDLMISEFGKLLNKVFTITLVDLRTILSAYIYKLSIQEIVTFVVMSYVRPRELFKKSFNYEMISKQYNMKYNEFKCVVMDTIIDMVIVFNMFTDILVTKGVKDAIKWCDTSGIKWNTLLQVIERRLDIFGEIMGCGLNPVLYSDINLSTITSLATSATSSSTSSTTSSSTSDGNNQLVLKALLKHIRLIKKCMFDGHRHMLLKYNKENDVYMTRMGLRVRLPFWYPTLTKDIIDSMTPVRLYKPTYIYTMSLSLENTSPVTYKYEITCDHCSVIDGFIPFDEEIYDPEVDSVDNDKDIHHKPNNIAYEDGDIARRYIEMYEYAVSRLNPFKTPMEREKGSIYSIT